jgi:ribonuclease P protein component
MKLRRSADFARVMSEGRLLKGSLLLIRMAPGLEGLSRIGYTVSKRNGPAVKRNRVKRMFREAARMQGCLPIGMDLVLVPRFQMLAEGMKSWKVAEEMRRLLLKELSRNEG